MHWIEKLQSPIIYGHRGASKYAPENTIAAFELDLQQGDGLVDRHHRAQSHQLLLDLPRYGDEVSPVPLPELDNFVASPVVFAVNDMTLIAALRRLPDCDDFVTV